VNGLAASGLLCKCYGLLLSGWPADPELGRGAIIFLTLFSYEKSIRSREKVGAVPFTSKCLENECICQEVDDGSTDDNGDLKLDQDLENACVELVRLSFIGEAFCIKMKWQAEHLLQQLPETATAEERATAIVKGGINMTSIFYNIGPSCLSKWRRIFASSSRKENWKDGVEIAESFFSPSIVAIGIKWFWLKWYDIFLKLGEDFFHKILISLDIDSLIMLWKEADHMKKKKTK
jgi:hypothetical protein